MKFTLSSLSHASLALVLAFTLPNTGIAATKSAAGDVDCQITLTAIGKEINGTAEVQLQHNIAQAGNDYEITVTAQVDDEEADVNTFPAQVTSSSKEHTLTYRDDDEINAKLIYPLNGGKAQLFYQFEEDGKWINVLNTTFKENGTKVKFLGQCNYTPAQ